MLNQVKSYSLKRYDNDIKIYGISQNPDTKDYILVLQNSNDYCIKCENKYTNVLLKWCVPCKISYSEIDFISSKNERIDKLIQKMQVKINYYNDITFEWMPYNQFSEIKKIGDDGFIKVYSVIWKNGPLNYKLYENRYTRDQNKQVYLKCINNSQYFIDEFLSKV